MAAVEHCLRHLQASRPTCFAPSTSQRQAEQLRHCSRPCRKARRVAAAARRKDRGTMQEQLAELLPEEIQQSRQRQQQRGKKQRRQQDDEQDEIVEEDVEIFNIDSGWSADAFAPGGGMDDPETLRFLGLLPDGESVTEGEFESDELMEAALKELGLDNLDLDFSDEELAAGDDEDDDFAGQTVWTTDNYNPADWDDEEDEGAEFLLEVEDEDEEEDEEVDLDQDEDDDAADGDAEDDEDDDDAWTVTPVSDDYRVEKASQGSKSMRETEVGPAMQRLLDSMPPSVLRQLKRDESAAAAEAEAIDPRTIQKAEARRKTHRQLRIISGTAGGKRLLSPQGDQTRPMMEMVRAAVFSMIQARIGSLGRFPPGCRWLDLFAGTGSVGLEALSRGCDHATFIEMDPWVTKACLQPNIRTCDFQRQTSVFTTKAEGFLQRVAQTGNVAGGGYDFISVCPPYLLVSYPEIFQLLESGPLAKPTSIIIVEYPKRLAHEIPDTLCGLTKVRDRKYGRTFMAMYAPADEEDDEDSDTWQAY